jgi:bacterioferritin
MGRKAVPLPFSELWLTAAEKFALLFINIFAGIFPAFQGGSGMKGNEQVIEQLNARLADELTAINQYMVHSEMCDNWGYQKLHAAIEKRAFQEMKHAEKLIARILFLEGRPIVSDLRQICIGSEVEKQHQNDCKAELTAIRDYNESIRIAREAGDNGTREMLESILRDEEDHLDWLEAQLDQIRQMGIQNYLVEQLG